MAASQCDGRVHTTGLARLLTQGRHKTTPKELWPVPPTERTDGFPLLHSNAISYLQPYKIPALGVHLQMQLPNYPILGGSWPTSGILHPLPTLTHKWLSLPLKFSDRMLSRISSSVSLFRHPHTLPEHVPSFSLEQVPSSSLFFVPSLQTLPDGDKKL